MKIAIQFNLQMAVMPLVYIALGVLSACAQATIDFRNTGGTPISTNDFQGNTGLISGSGNYEFGLYLGPVGNSEDTFLLRGLATNTSTDGLFGSSLNPIPIGFPVGTQVSFDVRGWSSFAGSTYDQALAYATGGNLPPAYLGKSVIGSFTVPASGSVIIFGSGLGQVLGFELTQIPEPSSAALGVLGLVLLSFTRSRKTRQSVRCNPALVEVSSSDHKKFLHVNDLSRFGGSKRVHGSIFDAKHRAMKSLRASNSAPSCVW